MHMILSGLNEKAALACLGHVDSAAVQWQPTSLFLAEAELATDEQERQWVWLYRAPWSLMTMEDEQENAALLHRWQVQQRAVLQLRRHLRRGLLLVNADRVSTQALAGHLGLVGATCTGEAASASPLSAVLAGVFEQLAPECWELYEALEATSWLPEGAPEFRANREPAPVEALPELLDLLAQGQRLPALEAQTAEQARMLTDKRAALEQAELQLVQASSRQDELNAALTAAERKNRQYSEELQQLQQQLSNSRAEQQSASEENELLLNQLHQVQEELEKHYLDSQSLREQLAERDKQLAATKAQQEKLDVELVASRKVATQADEACKKLTVDNNGLRQQLAAEQEANRKAATQAEEARKKLTADIQRLQQQLTTEQEANRKAAIQAEEARKKLATDIQRLQQQLADKNTELQSTSEENDLLLAQLHQVQEELESYYLANREILGTMGQCEQTLHRARRTIGLMASEHAHAQGATA